MTTPRSVDGATASAVAAFLDPAHHALSARVVRYATTEIAPCAVGVLVGHPVERLYRAVRSLRIYEGATDVQHLIIAGALLGARE